MKLPRNRQQSMMIIELLVAIAVLVVGVAALMTLLSTSADTSRRIREYAAARYVAEHHIELLRQDAARGKKLSDAAAVPVFPGISGQPFATRARAFLTIHDDSPSRPGLKQVSLILKWPGRDGLARQYELTALIAQRRQP